MCGGEKKGKKRNAVGVWRIKKRGKKKEKKEKSKGIFLVKGERKC